MTLPSAAVAEAEGLADTAPRGALERGPDLSLARAGHHRARDHDEVVVVPTPESRAELLDGGEDVVVGERPALVRGCRHEQDRHVALRRDRELGRRAEPLPRPGDELLEPRLLDRRTSLVQQPDGLGVDVDAEHFVALAREHGRQRRAELAEADDGDLHQPTASAVISRCQPNRCSNALNRGSGIQRKYGSLT